MYSCSTSPAGIRFLASIKQEMVSNPPPCGRHGQKALSRRLEAGEVFGLIYTGTLGFWFPHTSPPGVCLSFTALVVTRIHRSLPVPAGTRLLLMWGHCGSSDARKPLPRNQ